MVEIKDVESKHAKALEELTLGLLIAQKQVKDLAVADQKDPRNRVRVEIAVANIIDLKASMEVLVADAEGEEPAGRNASGTGDEGDEK